MRQPRIWHLILLVLVAAFVLSAYRARPVGLVSLLALLLASAGTVVCGRLLATALYPAFRRARLADRRAARYAAAAGLVAVGIALALLLEGIYSLLIAGADLAALRLGP